MLNRFLLFLLLMAAAFVSANAGRETVSDGATGRFLQQHWRTPVAPQGEAPPGYSELESSLLPEACGECHVQQYRDWGTSLHSRAMGPGVLGQTLVKRKSDPAAARVCWSCHAPLSEQQPVLFRAGADGEPQWVANPDFDPRLQRHGLTCAACHVRKHRRIGPPRRGSPEVIGTIDEGLPHGGFIAEPAYGKSAFCKGCHQFGPEGHALNGKLIQNTYQEWLDSDYPARGMECQSCHMPDRRHLWRGIHDPDMTRSGVTITVGIAKKRVLPGHRLEAVVKLANTGTGHYFPTYLTPRVVIIGEQIDERGSPVANTRQQMIIGREVTLNLSREIFDTRIPPGQSALFSYQLAAAENATRLRIRVVVEPDYFYERFFRAMLDRKRAGEGRELIQQAWENARGSPYTLFEKMIRLR